MLSALAERFFQLFAGLTRAYGTYNINPVQDPGTVKAKGKARTVSGTLSPETWKLHLDGVQGLGIVAIRDDSTCSWGALDIDKYDLDLPQLEKQIISLGLPLILCRTKSGGAHLYLFTQTPVPATLLRIKLRLCAEALGFFDTEVFPKQDHLVAKTDVGNWINMPYFQQEFTMRYAIRNGVSLSATEFLDWAAANKVSAAALDALDPRPLEAELVDGPPCLEKLCAIGFPPGSMNNALFSLGVYYRQKYETGWEEYVHAANKKWMSGNYTEVQNIIKSLNRKVYKYKCSDEPLARYCAQKVCGKRKYGIPTAATTRDEVKARRRSILDEVDKPISCYVSPPGVNDEPYWVFSLAGQKFDVTCDMIQDQRKFLRAILVQFQRLLLPIKEDKWAEQINDLTTEALVIELPRDAGNEGQLWNHLESFCTGRAQGLSREDLLNRRVWTEDNLTYFRSEDFYKYLAQQQFREIRKNQIFAVLRRHGARHHQFNIKGKCCQVWYVPEFTKQNEDLDNVTIPVEEEGPPF